MNVKVAISIRVIVSPNTNFFPVVKLTFGNWLSVPVKLLIGPVSFACSVIFNFHYWSIAVMLIQGIVRTIAFEVFCKGVQITYRVITL